MPGFLAVALTAAFAIFGQGPGWAMAPEHLQNSKAAAQGRLTAHPPADGDKPATPPSIQTLEAGGERVGLISVPPGYRPDRPAPLLVFLHGAGGEARDALGWLQPLADEAGAILLAPQSKEPTWDVIMGRYGPDVRRIDGALAEVFRRFAVDPARTAVGGFSDGASYALSLGGINGALFTHVLAFAPGFVAPTTTHGTPRIFITHGTGDPVLPIDRCSRKIVPRLEQAGYKVVYREFDGDHVIPPTLAREAFGWFLGTGK